MQDILDELESRRARARLGGGEKRIEAQHVKGKLTARERIELLVDESSFEEWDMFVEQEPNELTADIEPIPGDGVVTGWGTINGRTVFVFNRVGRKTLRCSAVRCRRLTRPRYVKSWTRRWLWAPR